MKIQRAVPKFILSVVYQTKNKNWRGFCFPFDITCEAFDKETAMKKMDAMVDIYIEGLKKYNFPEHLSIKKLTNKDDRAVFKKIQPIIAKKVEEDLKNYQAEKGKIEIVSNKSDLSIRSYNNELAFA